MNILQLNSEAAKDRKEPHQVFVYGTLKKGFGNHDRFLKNAKMLGQAQVDGIMFHLGGFPAISLGENFTKILGEVYQVTWDDILSMDILEGHPDFYKRVEIAVYPYRKAWVYILPHDLASKQEYIIPSGMWRGDSSPKVAWGGWGKGALVGAFQTNRDRDTILLGYSHHKSKFALQRELTGKYKLVNLESKEVLGDYQNLGDLIQGQSSRSVLSLPSRSTQSAEDIKRQVYRAAGGTADNFNPPGRQQVIDSSKSYTTEPPKTFQEPQAARMLGVTVKEA